MKVCLHKYVGSHVYDDTWDILESRVQYAADASVYLRLYLELERGLYASVSNSICETITSP